VEDALLSEYLPSMQGASYAVMYMESVVYTVPNEREPVVRVNEMLMLMFGQEGESSSGRCVLPSPLALQTFDLNQNNDHYLATLVTDEM
jgi:hypothetical protein